MKKSTYFGIMAGAVLVLANTGVRADTVAQKQMKAGVDQALKEYTAETNTKCGTAIAATINWKSFEGIDAGSNSIDGYCEAPQEAISMLCDSDDGKAAVKEKIKKIVCSYGGKDKRAIKLNAGTLSYSVDWDASNNGEFCSKYLKNVI